MSRIKQKNKRRLNIYLFIAIEIIILNVVYLVLNFNLILELIITGLSLSTSILLFLANFLYTYIEKRENKLFELIKISKTDNDIKFNNAIDTLNSNLKNKSAYFKWATIYLLIFDVVILVFTTFLFAVIDVSITATLLIIILVVILGFLAIICMLSYILAKNFKNLEKLQVVINECVDKGKELNAVNLSYYTEKIK
ncbi:MAG: hypothetical protein QW257_02775 [Candidatus Micrarchaeaceae archaeon]